MTKIGGKVLHTHGKRFVKKIEIIQKKTITQTIFKPKQKVHIWENYVNVLLRGFVFFLRWWYLQFVLV